MVFPHLYMSLTILQKSLLISRIIRVLSPTCTPLRMISRGDFYGVKLSICKSVPVPYLALRLLIADSLPQNSPANEAHVCASFLCHPHVYRSQLAEQVNKSHLTSPLDFNTMYRVIHMDKQPCLCNFTPDQLSYIATTFAVAFSKDFNIDELGVLSSFFFNVGSVIGLIARQRTLLENDCKPKCAGD